MLYDEETEQPRSFFHTLLHNEKIGQLRKIYGWLLALLMLIMLISVVSYYQIKYCEKKYPGKSIKVCLEKQRKLTTKP